jgi:undecaprenyl diphosphate synthase
MVPQFSGIHVAIIMDGNGRWAQARGMARPFGHRAGAQAVRRAVEAARRLGVGTLTLYAFSSDNWKRPGKEVSGLMRLFRAFLAGETARCVENGIRLQVVGRRDRLSMPLLRSIEAAEKATASCTEMRLRVAVDYSARDSLLGAAAMAEGKELSREDFSRLIAIMNHDPLPVRDVDLLIRTGGEQRVSDFLLWEIAYAELLFLPLMWPEFTGGELESALRQYSTRERRFGALLATAATAAAAAG